MTCYWGRGKLCSGWRCL